MKLKNFITHSNFQNKFLLELQNNNEKYLSKIDETQAENYNLNKEIDDMKKNSFKCKIQSRTRNRSKRNEISRSIEIKIGSVDKNERKIPIISSFSHEFKGIIKFY